MSEESNRFRFISSLNNDSKETLENETVNDDTIASFNVVKASPHNVFIQDKLVAVYNFSMMILMKLMKYMKLKLHS